MKALTIRRGILFALLTFVTVHSRGQGLILFYNNNLTGPNGTYRAGVFRDNEPMAFGDTKGDSTIGAGAGYTIGLFLATRLDTPIATTTFQTTGAGEVFFEPQIVAVPGVPPGATANFVVRAWSTEAGSYTGAEYGCCGFQLGQQAFRSRPLGETVPVDMGPGFIGFEMETRSPEFAPPPPLANASFESPGILNSHVQFGTPPSWTVYNPQNINGSTDAVGVLNATGSQQYATGVSDGVNAGLVHLGGPGTGEAGLQQTLEKGFVAGQYYIISSNTMYFLRVRVGNPASGMSGIGYRNLDGFPGYRIDLLSSDGTVLASDNNTLAIAEGKFEASTIEFVVGENHPKMGQGLQVRLVNLNQRRAGEPAGVEVNFDKVSFAVERLTRRRQAAIRLLENDSMSIDWLGFVGDVGLQATSDLNNQWQAVTAPPGIYSWYREVRLPRPTTSTYFRVMPAP